MSTKRKNPALKSEPNAIAVIGDQASTISSPHPQAGGKSSRSNEISQAAKQAFANWMKQVFGSEDRQFQSKLLDQASCAMPDFVGREMQSYDYVAATYDYVAAALHGIGPNDSLEGMLAGQMVAVHSMAMECLKRAALTNQTDFSVEANINRAVKLTTAFARLTEALSRHRGKGEQKMIVEHVHIHKGGQAIVGTVNQANSVRKGGDDEKR